MRWAGKKANHIKRTNQKAQLCRAGQSSVPSPHSLSIKKEKKKPTRSTKSKATNIMAKVIPQKVSEVKGFLCVIPFGLVTTFKEGLHSPLKKSEKKKKKK